MKLLTVFGATGNQGGSVIAAVLSHPEASKTYRVRGVTRDPSKPSSQALASRGVELVQADLGDKASLAKAVEGSDAVFAVTNFWESRSKELEVAQGRNMADASRAAGVRHLVWSSVPHAGRLTEGKLARLEHFDGKADVEEYVEGVKGGMIATYWMPGFFMQNIKGMINPGQDGSPTFAQPWDAKKTQVPLLDVVGDTGKFVVAALLAGSKANGHRIQGVSQWLTPEAIVDALTKYGGKEVKFAEVPPEVYKSFLPAPIAEELTETMLLVRDYSYYGKGTEKKQAESNALLGGAKTVSWAEFVEANKPW